MQTDADTFARIAVTRGVPKDKILIENQSTNTGENIQFTHRLLQDKNLHPDSLLLVQKPYMERRTYATFKKQWPDPSTEIIVTSPQIEQDIPAEVWAAYGQLVKLGYDKRLAET